MAGDLQLQGEVGFVREKGGVPVMMGLWGGLELRWGDYILSGSGTCEGEVTGALQPEAGADCNALIVTGDLPEGETLSGTTALVTFGDGSTRGYRVEAVRRAGGQTRAILDGKPGFSVEGDGARHLFFPLHEVPGRVGYRIRASAFRLRGTS